MRIRDWSTDVCSSDLLPPRHFPGQQKRHRKGAFVVSSVAERTGLEPATPGVTGRYSNQLNYHSTSNSWWVLRGSNPRPTPCKGDALPTELSTRLGPDRKSVVEGKGVSGSVDSGGRG